MIYRKGDDQSPLFTRAKEQERTHVMSEADRGGKIIGFNPKLTVEEYSKDLGGGPVSAKGMRMGAGAKHWAERYPHMWGGQSNS